MSLLRVASVGCFMLAAGCALDEASTSSNQQQILGGGCDDFGCGLNSPEIDHLGIHDLHGEVGGKRNKAGFFVTQISKTTCAPSCTTRFYDRVYASAGVLTATGPSGTITGSTTLGLVIRVSNATTGSKYVLTIADVGRKVRMWAHITGFESWQQYDIRWDIERGWGKQQDWKAVCTNPPNDGSGDLLGMGQFHSVVFENDEIDAKSKVVRGLRPEPHWFNIGCAGHTIAKMLLTGNASAADAKFGFHSSWDTKTAALKMLTNDICGKGFPFTVAGQPLNWIDKNTYNTYPVGFSGLKEAEWSHKGATCLNKPRILANPTALGAATFPTLLDDIRAECGGSLPPACADTNPYAMNGHFYVSSNP